MVHTTELPSGREIQSQMRACKILRLDRGGESIAARAANKKLLLLALSLVSILAEAVYWLRHPSSSSAIGSTTLVVNPTKYAYTSVSMTSGGRSPILWVVGNLDRVGQTDSPGSLAQATLEGGRGEFVDFQLIVQAPVGGLTNVDIIQSDLLGPGNAILSSSNYSLYREHYVTFNSGSLDYGPSASNRPLPPGTYPDPLIPFNDPETGAPLSGNGAALQAVPFNLAAGLNQPIWCDLFIPPGTAPGQYAGAIQVTGDQGSATVQVSLRVWNFELPLTPSEKTSFAYFTSVVNDSHYQQALLRHKIVPWLTNPGDAVFNVSTFGMNRSALPVFGNATCSSMSPPPSVATLQSSAAQYPAGLPLDLYPADEIGGCTAIYPTIKRWAQNAHAAGVKVLITMSPDPALYDDGSGTGQPAVDYWGMLPVNWATSGAPGSFWSYNDLEAEGYSPKWQIDFLPINFRIQAGFLNQTQGATGLLYWRVDYWPNLATAWDNVLYGPVSGAYWPGEGRLVYPPGQIGSTEPAPSMRLKYLRDGIQDYEYVEMLKKLGQGAWALAQASTVAHDWANWSQSSAALVSVRHTLGQALSQQTGQ